MREYDMYITYESDRRSAGGILINKYKKTTCMQLLHIPSIF